ncbi:unnamed protein product [Miscanthus lutarioriparius]|uniref:F-box domain-containing protein n=1 Tax=Miscanthus lutarioriparius TaxID=422564 RepID=A0A811QPC9_9POAL|nr:unnamed protein product [Miscanthus lutarioriparius]
MESGADRISDLPEDVLHHILSLLPARDAVRTCVLAQSWRNRWRSAPALRFACSTRLVGGADAFRDFVDGLLRVRGGGPLLDSCDFDLDVDQDSCDFDLDLQGNKWIRRVLELKVRELRFRVSPHYPFKLEYTPLSSQHLTSLELTGVQDNDAVLDFYECTALESLKMERSHVRSTEMQSPSLKHLSIKSCFFDDIRTWMSFPSLVSFEFINNFARAPMLETMPCLEAAKVRLDHGYDVRCKNGRLDGCGDVACRGCFYYEEGSVFLDGLAEATYLDLSAHLDMIVFYRDLKWCPAFNKLKTLVLSKWFLSTDLSALIWFLHHTPLLEKLTLEIPKEHKSLMETEGSYNALEKSIASSHLQIVEIICKDVDGIVMILCVLILTPCRSEKYQAVDDPSRLLKQSDIKTANMVYSSVIVSVFPYSGHKAIVTVR